MTLSKEETKKINFLIRKASENDLKHLKALTEKKLSFIYLKDFNQVCKDVKNTLKYNNNSFLDFGEYSSFLEHSCSKLGIPHNIFEKVINHLKRTGEIYESTKGNLCVVDSKNISAEEIKYGK